MKIDLTITRDETYTVSYYRDWFWGGEKLIINGYEVAKKSALNPATQFNFKFCETREYAVGQNHQNVIRFEKERPVLFGGFRPHIYRIFFNNELVHEEEGF